MENSTNTDNENKKEDWSKINPKFAGKVSWREKKNYQQEWEEAGLTYQDAQEWITIGFKPSHYEEVQNWKKYGFTAQEAKNWIKSGISIYDHPQLAAYARAKDYQPENKNKLLELKTEFQDWEKQPKDVTECLGLLFPNEIRKNFTELNISNKNLTDQLVIDGTQWINLKKIYCSKNQLTSLNFVNCQKLTRIYVLNNQLTRISGLPISLTSLSLSDNELTGDLTVFSQLVNLEELDLSNNQFSSSLKPLKKLISLKKLYIRDTQLNSGLEFLPESLKYFYCQNSKLEEQLKVYLKEGEKMYNDTNHLFLLNKWREDHQELITFANKDRLKLKIASFEEQIKKLRTENQSLSKEKEEITKLLKSEKASFLQQIETVENKLNQKQLELTEKVDKLDSNLKERETTLQATEENLLETSKIVALKELELTAQATEIEALKAQLNSSKKQVENYLPKTSDEFAQLTDSTAELAIQKEQKINLESTIAQKEAEQATLSSDSDRYQILLAEITELKKKVAVVEQEIEQLRRRNTNLKEQLNFSYLNLAEELEKTQAAVKNKQRECEKQLGGYLNAVKTIWDKIRNDEIATLLQFQNLITRTNNQFASSQKDKILLKLSSYSTKLHSDLETLCQLQDHLTKLEMKLEEIEKANQDLQLVMIAPVVPGQFRDYNKKSLEENQQQIEKVEYQSVISEEKDFTLPKSKPQKLPLKIYNIKENRVEWTTGNSKLNSYAIISYVWGDLSNKKSLETRKYLLQDKDNQDYFIEKEIGVSEEHNAIGTTKWSLKAWDKAIATCKLLNIDYLWMDQLCIDQFDDFEPAQEVPKMRQYYSQAAVTLIAIHVELNDRQRRKPEEIIKEVVQSQWFTRSWTFQEGWLSKQTIFMFDNCLVNGSMLANRWVLMQPSYSGAIFKNIPEIGSRKIATPLGWVYYEKGYSEEDIISFPLNQALRTIKNRGRSISIDGIYSVLGLLSYGDKVVPNYKKWGESYTKADLKTALFNLMLTALKETGQNQFIAWHGTGKDWLPEIYQQDIYSYKNRGGTSIEGGINLISKNLDSINFEKSEIKNIVYKSVISESTKGKIISQEEKDKGSLIDSGACTKVISVTVNNQTKEIKLLSTEEILTEINNNDLLLAFSKAEWRSNKDFVLIVRKNNDHYQRIGLAEISEKNWNDLQQISEPAELVIKFANQLVEIELEQSVINLDDCLDRLTASLTQAQQKEQDIKEIKANSQEITQQLTEIIENSPITNNFPTDQESEIDSLNFQITELQKKVSGLENNLANKQLKVVSLEKSLVIKEEEITNFQKDNQQLIIQLLTNEKAKLEKLTNQVKNGQLELVDQLLGQQIKVKDLERYAENESLEQHQQLSQLVMLDEFKQDKLLQAELQARIEQPN